MRDTRFASSARLVMMAATCCARSSPRNVAPPLKSTSTRLSASGEWVAIMPSVKVRRNSDLPEPVAPMQSPCGPMPFSAASLISSSIGVPSTAMPIGTRSLSRPTRLRHTTSGLSSPGSPIPTMSDQRVLTSVWI
ncbi:Uncharacterised protein [Mycobacteroides abscessus subsp. abscessus]|nr:Uncharacterised protein [Mycobacteroides abscessus subsp. abscessus]